MQKQEINPKQVSLKSLKMEFHSVKLFREAIGVTANNIKLLCSSIFLPVAAEIWEYLSAEK